MLISVSWNAHRRLRRSERIGNHGTSGMPIAERRFKVGKSLCAYCSVAVSEEREDPIPMSLYPASVRPEIKKFLKIPACHACNHAKSLVDGELRDFLTIDIDSQKHPIATELFNTTTIKAAGYNNIRMVDRFFDGSIGTRFNPAERSVEVTYGVPFDEPRLTEAVSWLTRGMHWYVYGTSVDMDSTRVRLVEPENVLKWLRFIGDRKKADFYEQGDPYIGWWTLIDNEGTLWMHVFFGTKVFVAITRSDPSGDSDEPSGKP